MHALLIGEGRACADCAAGKLTAPPVKQCSLKPFLRGHGSKTVKDLVSADGDAKPDAVKLEKVEEGDVIEPDHDGEDVKPPKKRVKKEPEEDGLPTPKATPKGKRKSRAAPIEDDGLLHGLPTK